MDSVLRKFRLRKERRESEARQKLKRELFAFNTYGGHGFPNKPTAMAYDPKLHLLAIGTKSGDLRIYGAPGIEFSGIHDGCAAVNHIDFLPGQGRLVTVCGDNSINLWQINESAEESSIRLAGSLKSSESKLKTIQSCCLTGNCEQLLLGTEGGNVQMINILSMKLDERVIHQESIICHAPDDFKVNPGSLVAILQHPTKPHEFLIGYSRGLIILWNEERKNADHTYNTSQQLESLTFYRDGREFMSAHADGSYIIWGSADASRPRDQASTPYGPFPCKAINKIQWKSAKPEAFIVFSGGMPRASHGDKHTVSVMQGDSHVVFDLTSKVVDFLVLCSGDGSNDLDNPHSLVVLTEEELVAVDLKSDGWQTYSLPYLNSIHSSAILSASHVSNVPIVFLQKLEQVGEQQSSGHTSREWPINGGVNRNTRFDSLDLLLTGHEDGSVRFWDVSSAARMRLIYKLSTSAVFGFETPSVDAKNQELEDEWPPFRKIGTYDPYSDDPQLGIQKIFLSCQTETLILAGTAGQVMILQFKQEQGRHEVKVSPLNIVSDNDNYVWKGHEPLTVKAGQMTFRPGFQPSTVLQLHPPSSCTSLAIHADWKLLAIGTAFGYGLFDYLQDKTVFTKCTLSAGGESSSPRRRSLRKSLRESFRRLRGGRRSGQQHHRTEHRATKAADTKQEETKNNQPASAASPQKETDGGGSGQIEVAAAAETSSPPSPSAAAAAAGSPPASPRRLEQKAESRQGDEMTTSIARCIYFADTFLLNAQEHSATLWVGTNAGTVYIHQLTVPSIETRVSDPVACALAKEIQLRHGAPVIMVSVVDRTMQPLSEPIDPQHGRSPDMSGSHQVVICSEEQFKIFSLPNLKPSSKYKLTAHDNNTKVRKADVVSFRSKSDENYVEHDLACLTNTGQILVFSVPQLRSQLKADNIRTDAGSTNTGLFTTNGEGFFLKSPSEFLRLSLSARCISKPFCTVGVDDASRPALQLQELTITVTREPIPAQGSSGHAAAAAAVAVVVNGTEEQHQDHLQPSHPKESGDQSTSVIVDGHKTAASDETSNERTIAVVGSSNTNITDGDDVPSEGFKLQMSESSASSTVIRNVVSSRTIVTKTTVSRTTEDGTVTESSTNVQHLNTGQVHVAGSDNFVPVDGTEEH